MPSCGAKGVALTGVRIHCPALIVDNREMDEYLRGQIQIEEVDQNRLFYQSNGKQLPAKFSTTCNVLAGYFVEVPIDPPVHFHHGQQKLYRISVEVNFGLSKENRSHKYTLVQTPKVQIPAPATEFCCTKFQLQLTNPQTQRGNINDWQLITALQVQAL